MKQRAPIHGLMAEFQTPEEILEAAKQTFAAGYRRFNAYSPYPVHGLAEACGQDKTPLPLLVLLGGLAGCAGGFALQAFGSVIYYPMNVGGKPMLSWPAFIPITFETTVLLAALTAVGGMMALNGLPMPYHPVFNVERFALASRDHFFLVIESDDPQFDRQRVEEFLKKMPQHGVHAVEW